MDDALARLKTTLAVALQGDVRFLDELPTAIAGRVVTEGVLLLDQQPVERVRDEVRARMLYHDFPPFEQAGTREGLAGLRDKAGG